ncbi:6(G)-fructosyltransferase-like [Asparagus officinalis]|uniref:6(G)-fructosyltransferase-like n=1 Tax=Asparagus officinalis TaxID=4686 RepID=UPI00098E7067|nr:6(G)-fructosyltransferase-like [Asparagus officinalis]
MASPSSDLESPPTLSAPLLESRPPRSKLRLVALTLTAAFLVALALFLADGSASRFVSGLARKLRSDPIKEHDYPWTNEMLTWQRSGFHFQPAKNFQSDPNAAMYYKGWYHFFYQYNPTGTAWDYTISWGHAVSRDLIHWLHLPMAMVPDHWYDAKGVWSGYSTLLPDGRVIVLYTGGTPELVQVQNLAVPADASDPLLLKWKKSSVNPILVPPPGIGTSDFRDPFPIWYNETDSNWHVLIGSKDSNHHGIVLLYKTKDFFNFTLLPSLLHTSTQSVGMFECVDLYPVATGGPLSNRGLEMSVDLSNGGIKHVLKASMDEERHDYYAIGTFDLDSFKWTPDDPSIDVGVGLRYDWGKFYASKTFFDTEKQRRILWGYVGEVDSKDDDKMKGWATLQNIPRTILLDTKTQSNLIIWPVEEVEDLRTDGNIFNDIKIGAGSSVQLDIGAASQLDIEAEFELDNSALDGAIEADVTYNCSTSGGAANRGLLGPFGLLVLANQDLTEQTATYFYVSRGTDGDLRTHFCQDELRSSKAGDIVKRVVGSVVPVLHGETWSLRILVDHSIIESFAQRGRAVATSRVYPTEAIYNKARLFLFNNATDAKVTAKSVKIWHMNSTHNHPFPGLESLFES